ncbi:hypothetical protein PoB_001626600 [Plakobranchus ocellatus]|uniref:Uncharacterized protein n=1 Tax=Plakobranchus ocellatus TaxID=259542 RepID=A0AAV3Z1P4_9GAST|nr:hypothetical protein PoB_001626600 [Plakobranchus ocellatus]
MQTQSLKDRKFHIPATSYSLQLRLRTHINRFLPQQGDLMLLGPPSDLHAGGGARTRNRRVPADLRADPLATVPPTPY